MVRFFFYTTRIQEVALKVCSFKSSLHLLIHRFVVLFFISGAEHFFYLVLQPARSSNHECNSPGRIKHGTLFIWLSLGLTLPFNPAPKIKPCSDVTGLEGRCPLFHPYLSLARSLHPYPSRSLSRILIPLNLPWNLSLEADKRKKEVILSASQLCFTYLVVLFPAKNLQRKILYLSFLFKGIPLSSQVWCWLAIKSCLKNRPMGETISRGGDPTQIYIRWVDESTGWYGPPCRIMVWSYIFYLPSRYIGSILKCVFKQGCFKV